MWTGWGCGGCKRPEPTLLWPHTAPRCGRLPHSTFQAPSTLGVLLACNAPLQPAHTHAHTPQFVEDPYTKARFQPECAGQVSPVGDLSKVGLEASGLVSSPTQLR